MADSNIIPSTINLRSKGIAQSIGKIHKGCVKDATTKLSIGSIPSTYESIIYKTEHKKAFGTSEKRFFDKQNTIPTRDSNHEDTSTVQSIQAQVKVNHNRLGQNSFISKQKREWLRCVHTPGPTHYYGQQKQPRKCMTRQTTQKIRIMKNQSQKEDKIEELASPGPGQYIYDRKQFWATTNKGWRSSFQTKVNRDGYIPQKFSPGPGYYELLNKPQKKIKQNEETQEDERKHEKNILRQILRQNNCQEPGPFSYNQQIPTFKPLYERIKMSGNFMMPINPGKKRNKGTPAPTAYKVKRIYEDIEPKLIESTFFMSQTKREPFRTKDCLNLSPLNPSNLGHKNFHFNIKNQWIC